MGIDVLMLISQAAIQAECQIHLGSDLAWKQTQNIQQERTSAQDPSRYTIQSPAQYIGA